ncbi:MAG: hypothetical protein ACXVB9_02225 [Bdellovibrionota bacterium]
MSAIVLPSSGIATEDDVDVWRQALAFSLIGGGALLGGGAIQAAAMGVLPWHIFAAALAEFLLALVLLVCGPSRRVISDLVVLLANAIALACVLVNSQKRMESGIIAHLFEGYKIHALVLAFLAIKNWKTGAVLLLLTGALPLLQYYSWPEEWHSVVILEPGLTLLYVAIAAGGYAFRVKTLQTTRRHIRTELSSAELRRFARAMLSARDLSNTPLQTLKATIVLLRHDREHINIHVDRLERVSARLEELNEIFSKYEPREDLIWNMESLDSLENLKSSTREWEKAKANLS